ncbi:uncharacterized protein PAC_12209 [Phialocephala subalpina]|uniref:Uncharacterized protein n=1 Tax=Phialocephala subalpina TaxID=576137 RepID=A0A1L7XBB6_9HELO|nr:uncharacterized protein PAC_12209 [Phialocephala subalpina]
MAAFRRDGLTIDPDHGWAVTHRLRFCADGKPSADAYVKILTKKEPFPDDVEPVAANFTKWASPRVAAMEAKKKALEDMGLIEDAFGLFHKPDHSLFRFSEYGEGIHASIAPPEGFRQDVGHAGEHFNLGVPGQGRLGPAAEQFIPSVHGQQGVGVAEESSDLGTHGQGYAAGTMADGDIEGAHGVVVQNSVPHNDTDTRGVIAGAQGEQNNYAVDAESIGSYDETRSVSQDEDQDTTYNGHDDGASHQSDDYDGHTNYSHDAHNDSLAVFSNAPVSNVVSEDNPLFADLAKRISDYKTKNGIETYNDDHEEPFRPSQMVIEEEAGIVRRPLTKSHYLGCNEDGTDKTYKHQVKGLPKGENAALWLEGLPPDVTEADVLAIVDTGAVFAFHLNKPTWRHRTSAGKLVFMKVSAAYAFKDKCISLRPYGTGNGHGIGLRIGDYDIRAEHNDNGYREYTRPGQSRVLHIHGPKELVETTDWEKWFKKCIHFKKTHSAILPSDIPGEATYEIGFARVDGQAESIHHAVRKQKAFKGIFRVEYARDPCDPDGRDFESHRMLEARRWG